MDGIKSMKVCVIDIETMNTTREIRGRKERKGKEETRIVETRLMWIPGDKPVNVPARMPRNRARISSRITLRPQFF